ncbi:MAG: glycosyltransferase [Bacteroidaceae bacterium]|nr:glycosyltransferase [Bacteroidaceae bacterium]
MNRKPLKVLSVCTSDANGGAARAAYRIHQGVRDLGVDCRMLVKYKHTQDVDVMALDDFVPHHPFYQAFNWVRHKFKNKIQHFRWNRYPERENVFMSDLRGTSLFGALKKLDYDVLHLHLINQRFIPLEELPKDKPIVWTLHDSWPFCGICHYFFDCKGYKKQCGNCPFLHSGKQDDLSHQVWKKKSEIYRNLDLHIVCPSRWLADCARQSSLLGGFPIEVIPNCLDVNVYRPLIESEISIRWRQFQEKRFAKPFILYGAINAATDKRKGFSYLLSALRVLEKQGHGDDFELIVFGSTESELSMDVNIPIHYVGFVNDTQELVSLYNLSSVMVVPSLSEVFGQTASEALACGIPVVAFRCTGLQDVVNHKINGYLARPLESSDLAAGILWCLKNNIGNRLGIAGREKVLNEYAYEAVCSQYKQLYETLHHHYQS